MKIIQIYSHLNGLEYIQIHQPKLWKEITGIIKKIDAEQCKTKVSKEKTRQGKILYSPKALNLEFKKELNSLDWKEAKTNHYVTQNAEVLRNIQGLSAKEQKHAIEKAGGVPFTASNQTDFVKNGIAIEVQFGKYAFVAYDLFVKHMAFFISGKINVGIEILPMKELQRQMSSGVPCFENELNNVIRQGRSTPAVPLVLVGVVP